MSFLRFALLSLAAAGVCHAVESADFLAPADSFRPRPLWFWNNMTATSAGATDQLQHFHDADGYGGMAILPFGGSFMPKYLSEDYFTVYSAAAAKAKSLGMRLCIYDEYGFPSGSAGASNGDGIARFANAYPNDTIKRLDKTETTFSGPGVYTGSVPAGTLMACVAMNTTTLERIDLASFVTGSSVSWTAPAGAWKIMFFTCVKDGDPNVDYLSPDACDKWTGFVHQKYYDHLSSYFGPDKTIDGFFFDEITMYRAAGRIWTPSFNQRFQEKYGSSPNLLYPALWYDIGADTASARNRLFGLRAELYATGYPKRTQDWAHAHGNLFVTGHQDQEEILDPCNVSGDLMKCFKYQDIPGIDKIGGGRPTEKFYKVVSSSAFNWDKPRVMSETFGAMGNISWDTIYQVAMEQYTKGISFLIPHAVWYDPNNVTFLPELSYRNPLYSAGLPGFTRFMSRLNLMLQGGRHVADIGVLYPIHGLQAANYLDGPLGNYEGGVTVPEADYADVGSLLSDTLCRDFTFLHPEVIDEKCSVNGALFNLANAVNYEQYRVLVLPGERAISWSNLQKIRDFYRNGGKVIASRLLPTMSAEPGHDADVTAAIAEMFPVSVPYPIATASSAWAAGGYDANQANDSILTTRWNAADGTKGDQWLQIDFGSPVTFNKTITRETFNRITSYQIQYWDGSQWLNCATGTTVGAAKTDTFTPVTASKVRLYIKTISADSVSINEFEVYDGSGQNIASGGHPVMHANDAGGKSYFLSIATASNLREALDDALDVYDVEFEGSATLRNIHKVKDGRHLWYLANLNATAVDTWVRLRGNFTPQLWNPDTGAVTAAPEFTQVIENGRQVTRVHVSLAANKSVFIVAPRAATASATMDLTPSGDALALNLKRLTSDCRYLVEKSPDLENWQVFRDFTAAPSGDGTGLIDATLEVPREDPWAFFRLDPQD